MGRASRSKSANEIIERALLCKIFRCTPDVLDEMDWDVVELFSTVYMEVVKKNPLALFM